jgi:hypothetical protein
LLEQRFRRGWPGHHNAANRSIVIALFQKLTIAQYRQFPISEGFQLALFVWITTPDCGSFGTGLAEFNRESLRVLHIHGKANCFSVSRALFPLAHY